MSHALASTSTAYGLRQNHGRVLVISDSGKTISQIDHSLTQGGYDCLVVSEGKRALQLLGNSHIDVVLIDLDSINMPGDELVYSIRTRIEENFVPVILITSENNEELLSNCLSAGGDDFIFTPFTSTTLNARLTSLEQIKELKQLYKSSLNEQLVAKQILAYALSERHIQFEEIKLLSRSKGVFSGDLFLTAKHPDGSLHILLADFTGHGLSAAIGSLPVADIFSVMTEKGFEIDSILENINSKLHTLLPVSMFMACVAIKINSDEKSVKVWNGGMPDIYQRNSLTGEIVQKIESNHIPLGISDSSQSRFDPVLIEASHDDELIIYTDGLTDAANINGDMFGYEHLEMCFQNNLQCESIFPRIVDAFNRYCEGINPDDDVTLACIPCTNQLTEVHDDVDRKVSSIPDEHSEWHWYMELRGSSLKTVNPVPIVLCEAEKITENNLNQKKLSFVVSALYSNAIRHGILAVNQHGINSNAYLRIGLKKVDHQNSPALLVSVEDSGEGFDHARLIQGIINGDDKGSKASEGISLVYEICDSLHYHGRGNLVEAVMHESA